jgi:hypothetical protein
MRDGVKPFVDKAPPARMPEADSKPHLTAGTFLTGESM